MIHSRPSEKPDTDAGFALVTVLWFGVLIAALMIPFTLTSRTQGLISSNVTERERLDLLAEGLVHVLAAQLSSAAEASKDTLLKLNGEMTACVATDSTVNIRIQDHAGLIDLNAAGEELLQAGFRALGVDDAAASEMAKTVEYFRSPSPAVESETPASRIEGGAKRAPFESVSELHDIVSLQSISASAIGQIFTTEARSGTISAERLSVALLSSATSSPDIPADVLIPNRADSPAYTIEIAIIRKSSPVKGHAGLIVRPSSRNGPTYVIVEPISSVEEIGPADERQTCGALFGSGVTNILEGAFL